MNGVRFFNLLKYGFKYNKESNRLSDTHLPPGTPKYVHESRMMTPNNRSMIIEGSAYY